MLGTGLDTKAKMSKIWPLHSSNSESTKEDEQMCENSFCSNTAENYQRSVYTFCPL